MGTKKIQKIIKVFIDRVKEKYQPEKIILFGSYATGKNTQYSDVDILVVSKKFKGTQPYKRFVQLHTLAKDLDPDVNAFGVTPDELQKSGHVTTIKDALATGIVLHS